MSLPNVVTDLGPVKPHVRKVAEEIAARWVLYFVWGAPGRMTGDHARGRALDFMTYELGGGVDHPGPRRDRIGDEIAAYVIAHRARLNVRYVIWNRRIASAQSNVPWAWRTYTGSNPHTDHVHVSFEASGPYQPPEDAMTLEDRQWLEGKLEALDDANQRRYESLLKQSGLVEHRDVRQDAAQDAQLDRIESAVETAPAKAKGAK